LEQKGTLYKSRMVTPEVLQKVWTLTENGLISSYLAEKTKRDFFVLGSMRGVYKNSGV
jgi:methionyl-tRNA formyltransferase